MRQITAAKANLIKSVGVAGYLSYYLDYLKQQAGLTKDEVFESYYQVRKETLAEYSK